VQPFSLMAPEADEATLGCSRKCMLAVSGQRIAHLWTMHRKSDWGAFILNIKSASEPFLNRILQGSHDISTSLAQGLRASGVGLVPRAV